MMVCELMEEEFLKMDSSSRLNVDDIEVVSRVLPKQYVCMEIVANV